MTTLLANEDESSARGRLAREPGLLGLVGADVLERHVGGGGDPIGAEVGLEGRGHEHRGKSNLELISLKSLTSRYLQWTVGTGPAQWAMNHCKMV